MTTKFHPTDSTVIHDKIQSWLKERNHPTDGMTVLVVMEFLFSNIGVILEDYSDEIELHLFGKE